MTRRKKRKLRAFIKEFLLITLPFSAGLFMNAGDIIENFADKINSISIGIFENILGKRKCFGRI